MSAVEALAEAMAAHIPSSGWSCRCGFRIGADEPSNGPAMAPHVGPFESRDLALEVRRYVEIVRHTDQLWVQQDPAVSS